MRHTLSAVQYTGLFLLTLLLVSGGCVEEQTTQAPSPYAQMDNNEQFIVRVILLEDVNSCTFKTALPFTISGQMQDLQMPPARADAPVYINTAAGKITIAGQPFGGNEITLSPEDPPIFSLNGNYYRGRLKLVLNPGGNSFDAINMLQLEQYLAGVVGAEMSEYWQPAALRAQAIAARTYCLYSKKRFGGKRDWDVKKTQANQVYLGMKAESAKIWDAVNRTKGEVLVCRQDNGTEDIFPAYYSSMCGGHTEGSLYVFGDSFQPLAGVTCPYCKSITKTDFFFWPPAQFDKKKVASSLVRKYPSLEQLGEIKNIEASRQSTYGEFARCTQIRLVGSTGKSDFLKAEDLRLTIDPSGRIIRSTICQIVDMVDRWAFISGRGYGHGVGLCQYGAQAMAKLGGGEDWILSYYYPYSKITKIY